MRNVSWTVPAPVGSGQGIPAWRGSRPFPQSHSPFRLSSTFSPRRPGSREGRSRRSRRRSAPAARASVTKTAACFLLPTTCRCFFMGPSTTLPQIHAPPEIPMKMRGSPTGLTDVPGLEHPVAHRLLSRARRAQHYCGKSEGKRTAMTPRAPRNQGNGRGKCRDGTSSSPLATLAPWRFFCRSGATSRSSASLIVVGNSVDRSHHQRNLTPTVGLANAVKDLGSARRTQVRRTQYSYLARLEDRATYPGRQARKREAKPAKAVLANIAGQTHRQSCSSP